MTTLCTSIYLLATFEFLKNIINFFERKVLLIKLCVTSTAFVKSCHNSNLAKSVHIFLKRVFRKMVLPIKATRFYAFVFFALQLFASGGVLADKNMTDDMMGNSTASGPASTASSTFGPASTPTSAPTEMPVVTSASSRSTITIVSAAATCAGVAASLM